MILSSIPHAAASFLTHIADAAIRSLVLGCIAGLGLSVLRVKSVLLRLNVWRAVLCVALIMPFLGIFLPAITFRLPAQVGRRVEDLRFAYRAVNAVTNKDESEPARAGQSARNSSGRHVSHSFGNAAPESHGLAAGPVSAGSKDAGMYLPRSNKRVLLGRVVAWAKSELAAMPWTAIGALAYFLVTLGFLVRFAIGLILSVRLERSAQRVHDPRALELLSSRARSLGIKRLPRLAESELLSGDTRSTAAGDSAAVGLEGLGRS
jgi:hypothetical protein